MDGFVFAGDYEDEAFAAIVRANSLDAEFNRNVASELTHGCMFATVNRSARGVAIRMHTAEDSAAIWDVADQRIGAGMVVADARRTDWGGLLPVPTQVNLHLPGAWSCCAAPFRHRGRLRRCRTRSTARSWRPSPTAPRG